MAKHKFVTRVAQLWDATMNHEIWYPWESPEDPHCEESQREVQNFAAKIAHEAFLDGVTYGARNPGVTLGTATKHLHNTYPMAKPAVKYRTATYSDGTTQWQIRDGIAWAKDSLRDGEFRQHVEVDQLLKALAGLGHYQDLAIMAELAANPTEK